MAINNCSFDTNILLDWLLERNESRLKDIEKILAQSKNGVGVSDLVIAELAFVLEKLYGQPRDLVTINLGRVVNDEKFNCNRIVFNQALDLYLKHPRLSLVDCCAVIYAKVTNSLPLYTSDKALANKVSGLAKLVG